jgi:large subunit ribosomal protein L34
MHYPHKISKRHRAKKIGFLVRMRTRGGRKMINRKRKLGRKIQVV